MIQLPDPSKGLNKTDNNSFTITDDWYNNDWYIAIVTVLFFPAGIYFAKKRKEPYPWKKMFIVLGVVCVIGIANGGGASSGNIHQSDWDFSVREVEDYLKEGYLIDPDSYESIDWDKMTKLPNGNYRVYHKFRAKSRIGIPVVESKYFILSPEGKVISVY